jgi:hypothetical protein
MIANDDDDYTQFASDPKSVCFESVLRVRAKIGKRRKIKIKNNETKNAKHEGQKKQFFESKKKGKNEQSHRLTNCRLFRPCKCI